MNNLQQQDSQIFELIKQEQNRQQNGLVMIASENFTSPAVLETMASPLSNKYAEGYPQARYYTGNNYIDNIENLAINRAKQLFNAEHINVQPHSGTSANLAVYTALLEPGDKILSMDLTHGGHLSHGSKVSLAGKLYNIIHYQVNPQTHLIDYDQIKQIALQEKPKIIISGYSSYPRSIDFQKIFQISQEIGAYHLADISHIAGLCITGQHQSPAEYADIITTTTHKTLRGPRSAIIMCKKELGKKIDKAVFPGIQGGPFEHIIAAKAVCFKEAMSDKFIQDQKQTIANAKQLAHTFSKNGIKLISDGTDTHLLLLDLRNLNITGKQAADLLAESNIYTNFNVIPFDNQPPNNPSGLRLGTPALTTQGMKETEMELIGNAISNLLKNPDDQQLKDNTKKLVSELTQQFPIYSGL